MISIVTIFKIMFRVIVLKIDVQTCKERLLNRGCDDFIIGSEHDLSSCVSSVTGPECKLDVHSNDYKDIVEDVITALCLLTHSYSRFIHINMLFY